MSPDGGPSGADFDGDGAEATTLRMFLRGAGHSSGMLRRRPVIGIASSWSELNPCNLGLRALAEHVKRGVLGAGGLPLEFPTISLAEPFLKPTTMLFRNQMAMDVETMISASPIDAVVLLNGCDKTVPAQLMGALSAGRPAISLAAGPRPTMRLGEETLTIDDFWEIADRRRQGIVSDSEWERVEAGLNPGVGTCNVLGTAATMAIVAEVLGCSLSGTALLPASGAARRAAAEESGARAVELAVDSVTPDHLITHRSLENAWRVVCALGGSTNAVIHIEALAGRIGGQIGVERLGELARTTPLLGDVRPSGPHLLADLDEAGGVPAVMRELAPLLHLDALAGGGEPWTAVVERTPVRAGTALRPLAEPKAASSGLAVLRGSLCPAGAIIKHSAADPALLEHIGPAVVFDGVEDMRARIDSPDLEAGPDSVLVLRNAGPVGGPGMPEVGAIPIPRRLLDAGVRDMVRISDARMSGTARGTIVLHVAPESAVGGPLGLVRDGDPIRLSLADARLDLDVEPGELARRRPSPGRPVPGRGYDRLHHEHVLQADRGCDFDFLAKTPAIEPTGSND
jgi:dihydroxy-acid dehydratase